MISDVQSYASSYNGIKIVNKDECGVGEAQKAESVMICKKAKIDLLRSASKATMQRNTSKRAHKEPCNSPRTAP